ncbi:hypothetical protein E2C01_021556 [Portunus trituberculatus]|uniref:Uncharacterized protein n=1 Tax=Portunus trituberculatus TaxID=210409 RepID=A0A5B7E4P5_PORTR|nr:hypothetical protein [Portunus trituberculatus]
MLRSKLISRPHGRLVSFVFPYEFEQERFFSVSAIELGYLCVRFLQPFTTRLLASTESLALTTAGWTRAEGVSTSLERVT